MEELIKDGKITLVEDGVEKEYTVLFTFHNDTFKKDYFVNKSNLFSLQFHL